MIYPSIGPVAGALRNKVANWWGNIILQGLQLLSMGGQHRLCGKQGFAVAAAAVIQPGPQPSLVSDAPPDHLHTWLQPLCKPIILPRD